MGEEFENEARSRNAEWAPHHMVNHITGRVYTPDAQRRDDMFVWSKTDVWHNDLMKIFRKLTEFLTNFLNTFTTSLSRP